MRQPDVLELARLGNPQAIATWLNQQLQSEGVNVSVDREGSRLSVGFYTDQPLDRRYLIELLSRYVRALDPQSIRTINLFGYALGNPVPLWSYPLDLADLLETTPSPAAEPSTEELLAPPEPPPTEASEPAESKQIDRFLICGLGSLGQYCLLNLKKFALREFDVHIRAIDRVQPQDWEVENLTSLLADDLIIGDCRNDEVLLKAGIQDCRAILLVTNNENDNIEAAIAARRLNPNIRLVVRSSRQSLNQLLKHQLGNFVAFEPTELPANAFALAGLQADILGFFNIGDCRLQVVEQQVEPRDYRFDGFPAMMLNKKSYRLLSYRAASESATPLTRRAFYQWQPDTRVQAGDTIAYVEIVENTTNTHSNSPEEPDESQFQHLWKQLQDLSSGGIKRRFAQAWQWIKASQIRRLVALGLLIALLLGAIGTILLKVTLPGMTWQKAVSTVVILLLGGYGDVFGGLANDAVPWWVQLVSLLITLISLLFVLGVVSLVADNLLSSRFEFLQKRPPIPKQNHVVIVGMGRVGQRVATLLREFKQPVVAITEQRDPLNLPDDIPMFIGDPIAELDKVNLATAKSLILVTDDQMLNLEMALMARENANKLNRTIELVVRSYGQRFSDNLIDLLPDAKILAAYGLAAEAFAGAAFGENILGLFRLNEQTILVTEYRVSADDTLSGKLISQVAYGYGVVPIFHQREARIEGDVFDHLMPSEHRRLQVGDRFIVLASINGLRCIERGDMMPPRRWQLEAQKPLNQSFLLSIGNDLANISGCSLEQARSFMDNLPGKMELLLYDYQAYRLEQELNRQIPVTLTPIESGL
ncbi:NAD-binding protein [Oscillatoria sp. FACHB-1407]|uniref:potassium channel family protein n=1 Tax=Oscillatoria sp. FACHB-1407 TaxID=2692847 RepID=UPI001685DA85|nr:NAD-binding protein [Oscillatoria sp. FACHB-1407]MBD2460683.1 NAD-binding protein [Oscillatoria sp. FACHB-1407]